MLGFKVSDRTVRFYIFMKSVFIFTFLCLLYSCNVLNLDGSKPIVEVKDGAFDPDTGLDAWGYDPLSTKHVSAWNMPAADLNLTLPIINSTNYNYHFTIDWGDGIVQTIGPATGAELRSGGYGANIPDHTYAAPGIYTIEITGTFEAWIFMDASEPASDDQDKLIRVHSFGDLGFKYLRNAFSGCYYLEHFAGGYTSNVTDMSSMFYGASSLTSLNLSSFDTSNVTHMDYMFYGASLLTSLDLTNWDTTNTQSFIDWILGMTGTIFCNDPDNGGTGEAGTGTVNGFPCNTYTASFDLTINQKLNQQDPSTGFPIEFDVVFTEAIDPATFTLADITQNGTATGIVWNIINSGDNINFILQATAITVAGTIIPSVAENLISTAGGSSNNASTSTDNSVTFTLGQP